MALYPPAIKKLIPPDRNDPPIRVRMVILHVAVSNGDSLYGMFLNNQRDGGSKVESHFYVRFDGTVEQYRDTAYQADANTMANDFAMSIETAGMGDGTWTDAQLASLKDLIAWAHQVHGVPYRVPTAWNDPAGGVGWHNLFATQWAGGPRACPGPDRIGQIRNILIPWMASGAPTSPAPQPQKDGFLMALSDSQQQEIYDRVMGGIPAGSAKGRVVNGQPTRILDTGDGLTLRNDTKGAAATVAAAFSAVNETLKLKSGLTDDDLERIQAAVAQTVTATLADHA